MEEGRYYIYEICPDGTIKKASLLNFNTKEEAEKSIIKHIHPLDRKRLIAIKVHR
jgi:hypothetical protein